MGKIINEIKKGKVLVSDGAWGTFLQQKGLKTGECPEEWNLTHPEEVYDIAKSTTDFLFDICIRNNVLSLVGSNGWMEKGSDEKCHFDHQ